MSRKQSQLLNLGSFSCTLLRLLELKLGDSSFMPMELNVNTQLFWMKEFAGITGVKIPASLQENFQRVIPFTKSGKKNLVLHWLLHAEKAALSVVLETETNSRKGYI